MSGKVGFWRWLLQKIWKGIKTIPKLPKLISDDPEAEMALTPIAFLVGFLPFAALGYPETGLLLGFTFSFLILAHAFYGMEGDC